MLKIPDEMKVDDEMIGGVNGISISDHDVADVVKFSDFVQQNYMECKGESPSGVPLLEPAS